MIRIVIAASERRTLNELNNIVKTCCPNIKIESLVEEIKDGVAAINEYEPDIVIVDTKLKDGSGFNLIRHFDKPDFKIIFLSSTIDYAITAIKFNAIDYILTPVDEEDITLAINKASEIIRYEENLKQQALGESIEKLNNSKKIVLNTSDQMYVVEVEDVIRIEAESNYSIFYFDNDRKIIVSKSIKEFEESLIEEGFHRIHKSHIFNINKMSHFDKSDGGFVVMTDGSRVPVASRKRDLLLKLFEEFR
jgi:two-component system LytT family response regulator